MNNIFFTGDTHFNHANIIKYCNRPFKDSVEMNETIIERWNKTVGPSDLIYHLGDFCFGKEDSHFNMVFRRLNGLIVLIKGNHDKLAWRNRDKFYAAYDSYHEIDIFDQETTLCHYPLFRWNKSHHFSWMLHGHCHYTLPETKKDAIPSSMGLILDVGVDGNDFKPYAFEELKVIMERKRHYIEEKLSQTYSDKCKSIHESI